MIEDTQLQLDDSCMCVRVAGGMLNLKPTDQGDSAKILFLIVFFCNPTSLCFRYLKTVFQSLFLKKTNSI